jgi:hypothetical protein
MSLLFDTFFKVLCIGGFMLILLETGRRIGRYAMVNDPLGAHQGLGPVETGGFGMSIMKSRLWIHFAGVIFGTVDHHQSYHRPGISACRIYPD